MGLMKILVALAFLAIIASLGSALFFMMRGKGDDRQQGKRMARALGLTNRIILMRYVLPNAMGPLIVSVSAGLGTAMVLESAFSFLGIGVNPPTPSWGNMISDGLRVWTTSPHLLMAPAAVLAVVTVAFNFLGDGLNDALNPKGQK